MLALLYTSANGSARDLAPFMFVPVPIERGFT
jgi:hypothetical protein